MKIRLAGPNDSARVAAIYEPYVRAMATSFEVDPPSSDVMRARMAHYLEHAPWLVCEWGGDVVGYAYASTHRERLAYQWDIEVSVYVEPRAHRHGVGRGLYVSLFELLKRQGFVNAYAGITLPNPASIRLHEAMGFTPVGVYSGAGYKMGAWHDVGWWQLALQPRVVNPVAPRSFAEASLAPEWNAVWNAAMRSGESWLRR